MTPRVTVITPTCNRPYGFALLERWMQRQTRQPDEWIVADGGSMPAVCSMGQTHKRAVTRPPGAANFAHNLILALGSVKKGGLVIIAEDDDWYAPDHIETLVEQLLQPGVLIAGSDQQGYYNVPQRKWRVFKNRGASLCQTGLSSVLIPAFQAVIRTCLRTDSYGIDAALWKRQSASVSSLIRTSTVLGMKGMPGQAGLGIGHRPQAGWTLDPHGQQLREWIGEDADVYEQLHAHEEVG